MKRPVTLKHIERFLTVTGWGPSRFGRAVAGDPHMVFDMRRGREITPALEQQVATFIEKHVADQRALTRKLGALVR